MRSSARRDPSGGPTGRPDRLRLLIVSEVRILAEGLALGLRDDEAIEVVGTAVDLRTAATAAAAHAPAVVLVDMSSRSAAAIARRLRELSPGAAIVAMAIDDAPASVVAWAEAGIAGYVPRGASLTDLRQVVLRVARGESPCSPRVAAGLFRRVASLTAERDARPEPPTRLTRREAEVLGLIEDGLSNKEIAAQLSIALPTVKNHVHNILGKLDARRRGEAVALTRN
jgi:two-component system nitrate/nitrite response regulator NarL